MSNKFKFYLFLFLCCYSISLKLRHAQNEKSIIILDKNNYNDNEIAYLTCIIESCTGCLYYQEGEENSTKYVKIPLIEGKGQINITKVNYKFFYSESCDTTTIQGLTQNVTIESNTVDVNDYEQLFNVLKNNQTLKNLLIRINQKISIPANKTNKEDRLNVTSQVTLDLNGNTIEFEAYETNGDLNYMVFYVSGNLTIMDTAQGGTIDSSKKSYCVNVLQGGNLTIINGTYIGNTTAIQVQLGNVYLKGGYYEASPWEGEYRYTINHIDASYQNSSAKIIITGGNYSNYNPVRNSGENPGFSLVPAGWSVRENKKNDSLTLYEVTKGIEINSYIEDMKIILKCANLSNTNQPCNGNLYIKDPNTQQIEKLYIDSNDFTYSFKYTSYGSYEIYYTNSSTCELPNAEGKPHDAVYPIHVVKVDDPYIYVSNEYELIEALSKNKPYIRLGYDIKLKQVMKRSIITTVHLDLNNKTLSIDNEPDKVNISYPESNVFYVDGGHLIINGEGEINGTNAGEYGYAITVDNGGQVTIEKGTFKGDTTVIYVMKGTALLKGGYYEAKPYKSEYKYTINCYDANYKTGSAKIIITGGKYYKFQPNSSEGENPTANYVPFGYTVANNGSNIYEVSKHLVVSLSQNGEEDILLS